MSLFASKNKSRLPKEKWLIPFFGFLQKNKKCLFCLLDVGLLLLKVLALDQFRNVIVVLVLLALLTLGALLHVLVALGQLAERSEGVWTELVEDARYQLGELLVLAVAVDGKGVGWNGSVDYVVLSVWADSEHVSDLEEFLFDVPFGALKWITLPSDLNMLTSSIAWIGCTFIFLRAAWSFLSSVPELFGTLFIFLLGVPFPL